MHRLSLHGTTWWVSIWLVFAHLSGMAAISLGVAWFLTSRYAMPGPVVEALAVPYTDEKTGEVFSENPRVITRKVVREGRLVFRVGFRRNESCPGSVVETYVSGDLRSIIVQKRSTLSTKVAVYPNVEVSTQLPPAIYPGTWTYRQTVESEGCPGGKRDRPDEFTAFQFEVVE